MHKKTRQYVRRAEEREGITTRLGDAGRPAGVLRADAPHGEARGVRGRAASSTTRPSGTRSPPAITARCSSRYHEERLIAARTVYRCGRHAAEFHGGSVTLPGLHPNHLLVWRAVQWARERGCATYDMWGVPDEVEPAADGRPPETPQRHDGLWGVYRFKRGFGAQVVRYAGAYDLVLVPATLYSLCPTPRW